MPAGADREMVVCAINYLAAVPRGSSFAAYQNATLWAHSIPHLPIVGVADLQKFIDDSTALFLNMALVLCCQFHFRGRKASCHGGKQKRCAEEFGRFSVPN